jgi:predicted O-methyltransferase YrrM
MPGINDLLMRALLLIRHQMKAKGANSIHSPFIFEFYQEVIAYPYGFSVFEDLEAARIRLLKDKTKLDWNESGAGQPASRKSVAGIAASSLMPHRKAAFLFKLTRWLQPDAVIELGTSLGLTTSYLASAQNVPVFTFEAADSIGQVSEKLWASLNLDNIHRINGKIENTLPVFLNSRDGASWELAVVDANHRYQPTMQNFELLNQYRNGRAACLVFDDIYWSAEMKSAWQEIKGHPDVDVSLDLFDFGIVFFRPESSKEHFFIRW